MSTTASPSVQHADSERKREAIFTLVDLYLQNRSRFSRDWHLLRWRKFAEYLRLRPAHWRDAVVRFLLMNKEDAQTQYARFREWGRRRENRKARISDASGIPSLTRFVFRAGRITWTIPRVQEKRTIDAFSRCDPELSGHVRTWLRALKARRQSRSTLSHVRGECLKFGHHLQKVNVSLPNFSRDDAETWLEDLRRRKYSAETIQGKLRVVKRLFRRLKEKGVVTINPMSRLRWKSLPRGLPRDIEEHAALSVVKAARHPLDRALVELTYATGLRPEETVSLDVGNVSLREMRLKIGRGAGRLDELPLNESTSSALGQYLSWRGDVLKCKGRRDEQALFVSSWGRRLATGSLRRRIGSVGRHAGLSRRINPTTLRDTFAARFLDRGGDLRTLQAIMGHLSFDTTARYRRSSLAQLREVYDRTHPRA